MKLKNIHVFMCCSDYLYEKLLKIFKNFSENRLVTSAVVSCHFEF